MTLYVSSFWMSLLCQVQGVIRLTLHKWKQCTSSLEMKDLRNNTLELSLMHIWKNKHKKIFHTSKKKKTCILPKTWHIKLLTNAKSTDLIKWEMLSQKTVSSHTAYLLFKLKFSNCYTSSLQRSWWPKNLRLVSLLKTIEINTLYYNCARICMEAFKRHQLKMFDLWELTFH